MFDGKKGKLTYVKSTQDKKTENKPEVIPEEKTQQMVKKNMFAMLTPEKLLIDSKRKALLTQIAKTSELDPMRYKNISSNLIHNFMNHTQNLPETANSYYALPGGLVDHALNRTEAAMTLFREYIVQDGERELSEAQKLWLYALFSASILKDVGKIYIDFQIERFDKQQQLLNVWNPLLESLTQTGAYYAYSFKNTSSFKTEEEDALRGRLNVLLARMLMPVAGFNWIASNPNVLTVWLALLNDDQRSAGTLGAILGRADAAAIQRYLSELITRTRAGRYARTSGDILAPESEIDKDQILAAQFIQWLMHHLDKGQFVINKDLFMVPGGMLIPPELFKLFAQEQQQQWQAVQQAFLSFNLHQVGMDGNVISRFEQAQTQQMLTGIVFAHYGVALPVQVQVHDLISGKKKTPMNATEFAYMVRTNVHAVMQQGLRNPGSLPVLMRSGNWQAMEVSNKPSADFGTLRRV